MSKKVAVIMGSDSDFPTVSPAIKRLKGFGIPVEVKVMSAHRTPDAAAEFSRTAREQGFGVIIAARGGHLPACWRPTTLPTSASGEVLHLDGLTRCSPRCRCPRYPRGHRGH
ncbi:MAG: AIR carboxylase family protein [Acutalibacter sp.]